MLWKIVEKSELPEVSCPVLEGKPDRMDVKEAFARAVKECKENDFSMNLSQWEERFGAEFLRDAAEGIFLAFYRQAKYPAEPAAEHTVELAGISDRETAERLISETEEVVRGVVFARDMTNMPANMLRPMDFARKVEELMADVPVEVEVLDKETLVKLGLNGLLTVGGGSEFPPCLTIMRYRGNPDSEDITALVGKGVTCDTGGYCVKSAEGMIGCRGDMAGGAAVAGAIHALAAGKASVNVTGLIPMCENRISNGSMIPGDVITGYGGKTIQILNTDAEGRLILADAVAYAVKTEGAERVLDIATLTGAAARATGFGLAPYLADGEEFQKAFEKAAEASGERYLKMPIFPEYEKMIVSEVADVKNMGADVAGTITAGLFIRCFAEGKPWLHLDIAGTAWTDSPVFEFQVKGATGAGVSTMYYLCKNLE